MGDDQSYTVENLQVPQFIDENLLNWLFDEDEFRQWQSDGRSWQLRIVGKPGTGKTVLSTLLVRYLKEKFQDQKQVRVASLFFTQPIDCEQTLIRILLTSILRQLSSSYDLLSDPGDTTQTPAASHDGLCESELHDLRQSVYQAISKLDRIFLILDDIDLCYGSASTALEEELLRLKDYGASVMITSRLPHLIHTYGGREILCSNTEKHESEDLLRVWWACENCFVQEPPSGKVSCQSCKDDGFLCPSCNRNPHDARWHEPYTHIDRTLEIHPEKIEQFIARELEFHHGDLDLGSQLTEMPPLSKFGRALMNSESRFKAVDLLKSIVDRSEDVLAIVKLRIEAANALENVSEAIYLHDRLPTSLVTLFNAAINRVMKQPREQAELGMAAIAVVADSERVPVETVQQTLHREVAMRSALPTVPKFSLDEILRATNGLLIVDTRYDDWQLQPFHASFTRYINEDYNVTMSEWKSNIRLGKFTRSATMPLARDPIRAQRELAMRRKTRPRPADRGVTFPMSKKTALTEVGPTSSDNKHGTSQFRLVRRTTVWQ